jgi:hypothetical protein
MEVPVFGHVVAQKCHDGLGEIVERPVTFVVGDMLVHQSPEPFDGVAMRTVDEDSRPG